MRDWDADVRGSRVGCPSLISSAAQAKAEARIEALHAASEWGMTNIHVETDSQTLVHAVQSSDYDKPQKESSIEIFVSLLF